MKEKKKGRKREERKRDRYGSRKSKKKGVGSKRGVDITAIDFASGLLFFSHYLIGFSEHCQE